MKRYHLKKYLLYFSLSFLFSLQIASAQVYEGANAEKTLRGSEIVKINPITGNIQYALLSESLNINIHQLENYFEKVYHLSHPYALKLIKEENDEIGYKHLRFQQYYLDIPIFGGNLIVHMKNNRVHSFNGELFNLKNKETTLKLAVENCLKIALDTLNAKLYKWQLPEEETFIKQIKGDDHATWYPKGELIFCPINLNYNNPEFYLTYKFAVYANEPLIGENIYISPVAGQIIARENLIHTSNVTGVASTKYSGSQIINTDSTAPGSYRLRETVRGNGVTTLNLKTGTSYGAAVDFTDADNNWNNVNAGKDEVATDCHWGAGKTYDFYKSRFNRNSYDNNNAKITSYVHYSSNYDNAFWNGVCMTYGDGSTFKPLTSLDVCGHEITHAVTSNSAGLNYSYESGALNESFSDLFGNAIERYGKPSNYSWKIGEEITYSGNGLRNMQNPKLLGQPRCYKSTNWYFGTGDNGGVHTNSGVQNWWFYLISEGGTGTNDVANVFKVDSIGILKAEQIAYRNLTVYLTPTSQYADARFYSIRSATDLYGACSKEVIAVTNAWYACNVGAKYDSAFVKAAFIADTVVCNKSKLVKFTNLSSNAVSSKWFFGDGSTSSTFNPSYTYSNFGNYNIKLVATSCFKNKKDSITKTAYIKIDSTFDICNALLMPQSGNDSTHKCMSFVFDDGGEDVYKQQNITNYRISLPGADSIRVRFYDFDYEFGYDSLYIYKGKYPGGTKIGGFTGSTLPFGGVNYTIAGNMITLRHVSDQLVAGRGFKMYYTAFKKPVAIKAFVDTTICFGNSTLLYSKGTGGYYKDYFFQWKNIANKDSVIVAPAAATVYKAYLTDVCTKSKDSAQVSVSVRNPLKIQANKDTTICIGQSVLLNTTVSGGKNTAYKYIWDNGLGNSPSHTVTPSISTIYRVIIDDGCTPRKDTAFIKVVVRGPLSVKLNTQDTVICFNKTASFSASGSGGSTNFVFSWSNGLGFGTSKSLNLMANTWIKVSLTDGCTVKPAVDSVFVKVNSKLLVDLNKDTSICRGSSIPLIAKAIGGVAKNYTYTWTESLPSTQNNTVSPSKNTKYYVTLKDNCSDDVTDSITVFLLAPLKIKGLKDSTICIGQSVPLTTISSGGLTSSYSYLWSNGLGNNNNHLVYPVITTLYSVILSDACTVLKDTSYITIVVKKPLGIKLNTVDTLICYNKSSNLTATATGGNGNYKISWNNGLGNGASKSISLTSDTWMKVSLTDGCTVLPAVDSLVIKVRKPLSLTLNKDSTICKGTSVKLLATAVGGDSDNYLFQWSNGLPSTNTNSVSPVKLTKYYLTLKDNCSSDAKDSITIDVLADLKISGLKDTTICYGGKANFNPVGSGGIASQYQFQWDNGLGNNPNQVLAPLINTSYILRLKDNCTNPYDSFIVKVLVRPALKVNTSLTKYAVCMGDSTKLTMAFSGGIPGQYEWTINGIQSLKTIFFLKPLIKTHYKIELKDLCSNQDSNSFDIDVNPLPIVNFDADRQIICKNDEVQFANNSVGATSYIWKFNGTAKSTGTSPLYKYDKAGLYDVSLSAISSAGCMASLIKPNYIDVIELPKSNFTFSPDNATYLNPEIEFNNLSTDYSTFEWDFGDFTSDAITFNPVHAYGDTGNYKVRLTTKNSIGCRDVIEKYVLIKDVYAFYIPNAISVNEDGINDELKIVGRGVTHYNYSIYNRWGEKIFSGDQSGKPFNGRNANGEMYIKGTYLLEMTVKSFDGKVYYIKQTLELL